MIGAMLTGPPSAGSTRHPAPTRTCPHSVAVAQGLPGWPESERDR